MDWGFSIAAGLSVGAGIMVVTRRNPVHGAMWLLLCFIALAVVYLKIDAPFLAAMHVLVYTGAILVLFLFVIMLLNLRPDEIGADTKAAHGIAAAAVSALLFVVLAAAATSAPEALKPPPAPPVGHGSVERVGRSLFREFALPFELVSVLILAAIFSGVVLAKRKQP